MKRTHRFFCILLALFFISFEIYSSASYSYENEIYAIEALIKTFELKDGEVHNCTKDEVELLLKEGAKNYLNLFEILYATNIYLAKINARLILKGDFLREIEEQISYGNERVYALIPISIIDEVQLGSSKNESEHILDIFLSQPYQKYIEIGTAIYESHIGFSKIENKTFSGCFGMSVKKLGLKKKIDRIVMYEKTKIAIYVKAFPIPKKWNFENVYLK